MINWKRQIQKINNRGKQMPDNSVSIAKKGDTMRMSKNLIVYFEDSIGCEIYTDNSGFMGLSPSNERIKAFVVKNRYVKLPTKDTLRLTGRYYAFWDAEEEKVIVDLNKKLN